MDDNRCPACGEKYTNKKEHRKTIHHILPQRIFGKTNKTIKLCESCHTELETQIPRWAMLEPSEYQGIVDLFIFSKNASLHHF